MHASYTTNYARTGAATNALCNSEVKHRAAMRVTVKHDLLFKAAPNTDKCYNKMRKTHKIMRRAKCGEGHESEDG
jgi:hypothetical protein